MGVLINSIVGIPSQYIPMSSPHIVHFKYVTILFVKYISIIAEKKKEKRIG